LVRPGSGSGSEQKYKDLTGSGSAILATMIKMINYEVTHHLTLWVEVGGVIGGVGGAGLGGTGVGHSGHQGLPTSSTQDTFCRKNKITQSEGCLWGTVSDFHFGK
jgi:hypothetical protein